MSILTKLATEVYDRTAFVGFSDASDFSITNAKALMWLSQLSYETDDPSKIADILEAFGAELVPGGIVTTPASAPLPMARTEALVVAFDRVVVLAFAGTDPIVLQDWVADFDIRPNLGTTEGFSLALRDALPAIRRVVGDAGKPVFVTGHSLGGALAVLAAQDLAENGVDVRAAYTYGMPRPGGRDFAVAYDVRLGPVTYRLVHGDDVVPTVAPSELGFRHVGRLLSCEGAGRFEADRLAAGPGSDKPPFLKGIGQSLVRDIGAFFDPGKRAGGFGELGDHAVSGPSWDGRPSFVQDLIRAQAPIIRDHLPDSYIHAFRQQGR